MLGYIRLGYVRGRLGYIRLGYVRVSLDLGQMIILC